MSKSEVKLQVKFKFEGEYPKQRIEELMNKVADALHHEYASGNGFAPDDEDGVLTDGTEIKCGNKVVIDNYFDNHVKGRYTHILDFSEDSK